MEMVELLTQNRHKPLSDQLLQDYPEGFTVTQTHPIALDKIKDIYRFRAKRNENMGEPIQGFPELIAGLDTFSGDAIVIYSIDAENGPYKIFADADGKELAGILKFP